MPKHSKDFQIWMMRLISVAASLTAIIGGIIILSIDGPTEFAMFIYIIVFGIASLLAEFRSFSIYKYIKFMYTPIGRGLLFVLQGCLVVEKKHSALITGIILIVLGAVYALLGAAFGGVPKPLQQCERDNANIADTVLLV